MPPSKDHTKYIFCGKKQGKSRLVLSVLTKHSAANPSMTYDDLKEAFPDALQSDTEIQFSSTQVVFDKESEVTKKDLKRFYLKEEEIIQIKDCKVAVSTEWNYQNIQNFINAARKLGHEIDIVK